MKHAGLQALNRLEPLLKRLRDLPQLKEKSPGVFYRGSRAFLHFHEDSADFWADMRLADAFERLRATTATDHVALIRKAKAALSDR
jgi:hypothetical protein